MGLSHPAIDTRDMALYRPLRKRLKSRFILDLSTLVRVLLGREIGQSSENSVSIWSSCEPSFLMVKGQLQVGVTSMELYHACQSRFEAAIDSGSWPCDLPPISFARHFL